MAKKMGIILIALSFILIYFSQGFIFPIILLLMGNYILFINRIGKSTFEFTKLISKYPDEAYDWFKQENYCWKIYEGELPANYKDEIPSKKMRPLRLIVPKLGNKIIYFFGKFPECRDSEKKFIEHIRLKYEQKLGTNIDVKKIQWCKTCKHFRKTRNWDRITDPLRQHGELVDDTEIPCKIVEETKSVWVNYFDTNKMERTLYPNGCQIWTKK